MKLPFCAIEKITSYYKQPIIIDFVTFFRCIIAATIKRNDFLKIMNKPSRYLSRRGLELDIDPFTSL